jgi:hypothetical protein
VTIARRTLLRIIGEDIAGPRRGGFVVELNMTCESTSRRECSAKLFSKMYLASHGADVHRGDSTEWKSEIQNGAVFKRAVNIFFDLFIPAHYVVSEMRVRADRHSPQQLKARS